MTKTYSILIGNSDNKLTQARWSEFCAQVTSVINSLTTEIYFKGFTSSDSKYQSACWVIQTNEFESLKLELAAIRKRFKQDSIAFVTGTTEFI